MCSSMATYTYTRGYVLQGYLYSKYFLFSVLNVYIYSMLRNTGTKPRSVFRTNYCSECLGVLMTYRQAKHFLWI